MIKDCKNLILQYVLMLDKNVNPQIIHAVTLEKVVQEEIFAEKSISHSKKKMNINF